MKKKKKEKGREEGGKFLCTNEGIFIIHPTVNRLPIFPRELINFLFPDDDLSSVPLSRIFRDRRSALIPTRSFVILQRIFIVSTYLSFFFFLRKDTKRRKRIGISRIPALVRPELNAPT